jgi:hypothetical protein
VTLIIFQCRHLILHHFTDIHSFSKLGVNMS